MSAGPEALPDDIETLQAALIVARAEAAVARARQSDDQALIAHLRLQIEKLNRDRYGPRSERSARLLDQLELTLEELEVSATQDELVAEMAAARTANATTKVASFTRQRPSRKPFPEHLLRERLIVPGPTACGCCGGTRLSRLGEDVTETLEVIPKSWKVIQHVREKFSCRDCEKICQAPAPFPRPRARLGRAEPAGDGIVREVWPASAAQPAGRALCQGGRAAQPVDPGRSGWWLHGGTGTVVQAP
jgi:hypothetical protein